MLFAVRCYSIVRKGRITEKSVHGVEEAEEESDFSWYNLKKKLIWEGLYHTNFGYLHVYLYSCKHAREFLTLFTCAYFKSRVTVGKYTRFNGVRLLCLCTVALYAIAASLRPAGKAVVVVSDGQRERTSAAAGALAEVRSRRAHRLQTRMPRDS